MGPGHAGKVPGRPRDKVWCAYVSEGGTALSWGPPAPRAAAVKELYLVHCGKCRGFFVNCLAAIFRRRTNVQQLTCNIDLSRSFYYLFFSFVLIKLKPFVLQGKVLGEKFWKSVKKCEKVWNDFALWLLPFSFSLNCPQKLKAKNQRKKLPKFRRNFRQSLAKIPQDLRSGGLRAQHFRGRKRALRPPPLPMEDPYPTGRSPNQKS